MIVKTRYESLELKLMRSLSVRMDLPVKDENYYSNLEKGYKGEQSLDQWLTPHSHHSLILNDLLLECNNTLFQIDSLFITSSTLYLFEVKNYEGDYFIETERWYSLASKNEIKNPLIQMQRNESLFRRLLQELGFNFPIESFVIFINHDFQLYQTPLDLPIIFPTQLHRFLGKIKKSPLKDVHSRLAEKLLSIHLTDSPYNRLPQYTYIQLTKGIICPSCKKFYTTLKKTNLVCSHCNGKEEYIPAVLRSIEELKLLFPEIKLTTNQVHDWCQIIKSKRIVRNILSNHFTLAGHGKSAYYVSK